MTTKRYDESTRLIDDAINAISDLCRLGNIVSLQLRATQLITALEEHAKLYAVHEVNPTTRAWYLLRECMQHRTLLKPTEL